MPVSELKREALRFARSRALGKAWVTGKQPVYRMPIQNVTVGALEAVIGELRQGEFPCAHLAFEQNWPGIAFFEEDPPRPAA